MVWAWQTDEIRSNNLTHSQHQSKKQPVSQGQQAWPWLQSQSRMITMGHSPKLSQSHGPSQSQSQRPGHGHNHCPSQIHATITAIVICFSRSDELDQMGNTFTLVNLPLLLITSNAGQGQNHTPSHSHVIIRIIIISS